jgi:hypothetical protein
MSKVKKFRISPRAASVLKNLKALAGDTHPTPELEKAVEAELRRAGDLFSTAALYNTYDPGETPEALASLWEPAPEDPRKPVAITLYAATVGAGMEEELGNALSRGEKLMSQVLTAVGEESAEQAAAFVQRLVSEEAIQESCELTPRREAPEALKREVLSFLSAEKVGIAVDGQGHLSPRFTRVGALQWYPPKKKK